MIYEEIKQNLDAELFEKIQDRQWHLGVFCEPYLNYMMKGIKTIESRFSKDKRAPYSRISNKDIVFIKKSSGPIVGYFTIKSVKFFELSKTDMEYIKENYSKELAVSETFFIEKKNRKYATLIFIDEVIPLIPFKIHKTGMSSWIVL